jgi:hypothetical protein
VRSGFIVASVNDGDGRFCDGSAAVSDVCLPDRIGVGVLTRLVPRELVDEVVLAAGRREHRKRLLPARVVVYFVMGLALFYGDAYEEVMRKLAAGLKTLRVWRREWAVPTSGALTQARQRLGPEVMAELFARVAVPCAHRSTPGAWMAGRRLMSLDGFELDAPESAANTERFGYAGAKDMARSGFCKVRVLALAECGTHAIVGADLAARGERDFSQARRLLVSGVLAPDMLVTADRGLYGYDLLHMVVEAGAEALVRVKSNIVLPALKWLPDGSYLSYVVEPRKRTEAYRQLKRGDKKLTDLPGMYVRVVDYQVTGDGDGEGELFTLVTTIVDPEEMAAAELAAAYHERWEIELLIDEVKTHQRGPAVILRSRSPDLVEQELWGLLLTHYGIRHFMAEAADQADIDPDRLSFIRSLRVIRRQTTSQAAFSPHSS